MALGIALLCYCLPTLYFGVVSPGWHTTEGNVTYSTSHESRRRSDVDVRYTYSVDGRVYSGDRWSYRVSLSSMRSQDVSATQAAYPVGSHPQVSVDPHDSARSVLEPGPHWDDLIWVGAGLMFLVGSGLPGRPQRNSATLSGTDDASSSAQMRLVLTFPRATAGAGILLLGFGVYRIYDVMLGASWPTVEGRVLYSSMSDPLSVGNRQTEIRYEYFLAGQRHSGSASLRAGNDEARALKEAHPVGQTVTVHYDPSHPEHSTIQTTLNWHYSVLPAFACLMFLLARLASAVTAAGARTTRAKQR